MDGPSSARYRTLPGPSGAGGTIGPWQTQPSARARSALAASSRRSQLELRASPAVSPALSRRKGGGGERRRRAARAGGRERGSGGARRAADPHGRRVGLLRSALAFAGWSQSSRRPIGGRGAARARPSRGGGVAASAFAAVARPGRHRLGGDRADGDRGRDRFLPRGAPLVGFPTANGPGVHVHLTCSEMDGTHVGTTYRLGGLRKSPHGKPARQLPLLARVAAGPAFAFHLRRRGLMPMRRHNRGLSPPRACKRPRQCG